MSTDIVVHIVGFIFSQFLVYYSLSGGGGGQHRVLTHALGCRKHCHGEWHSSSYGLVQWLKDRNQPADGPTWEMLHTTRQ